MAEGGPNRTALPSTRANPVHTQFARLRSAFGPARSTAAERPGLPGACLRPLLAALGWPGESRHLLESLPHIEAIAEIDLLRSVLVRLNFDTREQDVRLDRIAADILPCLFTRDGKSFDVLIDRSEQGLRRFVGGTGQTEICRPAPESGTAFIPLAIDPNAVQSERAVAGWVSLLLGRFRRLVVQLFALSFLINMLALATPLFIMAVYDQAIGAHSIETLYHFAAGIGIALCADLALRLIRGRALAYFGTRVDALTGARTFERVLYLPLSMTERAPISAQLVRLRQFEGLRDAFSGAVAAAVLDLPFIVIFLAAIAAIGGHLAWISVALLAVFGGLALITIPISRRRVAQTGEARQKMQNLVIETVAKQRTINENGAAAVWLERFRELSRTSALRHFRAEQLNLLMMTLTQALVGLAGVGTLYAGVFLVLAEEMSLGALIASLAIVWRLMAPLQAAFLSLTRLNQVTSAIRQINVLMALKVEREPGRLPSLFRKFTGNVTLARVSFRHAPHSDPALLSVSLKVPAGQLVAITGPTGAGKSTLLKTIAGLYVPQGGSIQLDGVDIRQIEIGELRHAIGYVPDKFEFFHGTVEQNLRLAAPLASDRQLRRAWTDARAQDFAASLPQGLATLLTADELRSLPTGFKQRLLLARAWAKEVRLYLLDEPANNLDCAGDLALMRKLEALRGQATVIMVTHRPSHMRLADRVVYLQEGQVVLDGKPDQVLAMIQKAA